MSGRDDGVGNGRSYRVGIPEEIKRQQSEKNPNRDKGSGQDCNQTAHEGGHDAARQYRQEQHERPEDQSQGRPHRFARMIHHKILEGSSRVGKCDPFFLQAAGQRCRPNNH